MLYTLYNIRCTSFREFSKCGAVFKLLNFTHVIKTFFLFRFVCMISYANNLAYTHNTKGVSVSYWLIYRVANISAFIQHKQSPLEMIACKRTSAANTYSDPEKKKDRDREREIHEIRRLSERARKRERKREM